MIEDRELVDRLRGAIRAVRVPDQALDLRSRARRGVATLLAVPLTLVALVVALVIGQALLESRTERAAGTPGASNVKLSTVMQRAEAIGLVRGLTQNVGRVDRIEARLMTWAEYLAIAGSPRVISGDPSGLQIKGALGTTGDPSTRTVWVVAVAGEVWPSGRVPVWWGGPSPVANPTPYPPYRWAMFIVDASRGQLMFISDAGIGEPWPTAFERLPDHPLGTTGPAPVPTLAPITVRLNALDAITIALHSTVSSQIDRIQAKLMTWREYETGSEPAMRNGLSSSDPNAAVWAVLIANGPATSLSTPNATLVVVDAATAEVRVMIGFSTPTWPASFEALPDHPPLVTSQR